MGIGIAIAVVAIAVGVFLFFRPTTSRPIVINGHSFVLDVANTEALREKGLGGRESLASDRGMLFAFDGPGVYPFWMKDMKFPIDIVWLRAGSVSDVVTLPAPTGTAYIPTHVPSGPADAVLEFNAGIAEKTGLFPGTVVNY